MDINRVTVDSSFLLSVAYSPERCQLELELRSGELYQYFDVPPQTHAELMAADSKGEYFNANIRNCFPFQQIRRASATTPDTF